MSADETSKRKKENVLSLDDKLKFGNLSIDETCKLAGCSKSQFYLDVKAGRVSIRKFGRRSAVPGPIARAYIAGERLAG